MNTAIIHPNVALGGDAEIGDFVILGIPPRGASLGELPTQIGDLAVIRSHTIIYAGNQIGSGFQTGHGVMIREQNIIGDNVSVGTHSILEHHITLGEGVRIHSNVFVPEYSILEDECWLGPNVVLTNAKYPRSQDVKTQLVGPKIGKKALIGANATILPGVSIGVGALVGAGSVVVKDVPDFAVVVGNPAKIIGSTQTLENYRSYLE